jgi:hypothetical protein
MGVSTPDRLRDVYLLAGSDRYTLREAYLSVYLLVYLWAVPVFVPRNS